ncbi:tRNA synthetases class I, catalytic domain-containing protein [Halteromyces radiatus]|uniref:tRNA synthetases class I, catalytic domain-containing protein n=1 Tax=Halteromyces radiatus TaxID=101107 RepID=UPI00221F07F1|nr:tRNA synthetases class I, catalytic domain-containing protein [Halteromyces radiatus]KAI8088788.1 tRNA synthetases class I, catalytic domain-containing protein [Halteromyces radiatus]
MDELIPIFMKIGLSEQKAKDTAKNKKLAPTLEAVIDEAKVRETGCDKDIGNLLYNLASTITKEAQSHRTFIVNKIIKGDLKSTDQVAAAIKFVEELDTIDETAFNEASGVGVVITPEEIKQTIAEYIETNKENIVNNRYKTLGPSLAAARKLPNLKWADGGLTKTELEAQYLALLGPKDERDVPQKKKKEPKAKKEVKDANTTKDATESTETKQDPTKMFFEGELAKLHKPGGNKQIKPELMEQHLKATGGKVMTRFPPEPNGYLHIGHAKAINVSFGYAKAYDGLCYLRYDDTNPEAEEEKYFTSILETVRWLGFEPWKITYSSDYFQELFDLAIKLIKSGHAYTCQCTGEEIHASRGGDEGGPRVACVHRERPIEETLDQFIKMKEGRYKEGEITLRMKMDLENGNPQFWDLIAYRVLYTPHHRTGSKWCIYPTYDYTHCLVDSMENITHSLCTTEFRQSRESYYWLVDALEVYKPVQWEYGRLNVTGTIMSKRKILNMVNQGHVHDWDDPRLYTLVGIRRRGVPPQAINNFVLELGVTTNKTVIDVLRFDAKTREYLDNTTPRLMAITEPLKVVLKNLPDDYLEEVIVPNKPRDPSMGEVKVPFTKVLYIDRSDFREEDSKDYYRLTPGKSVGLLHLKHPVRFVEAKKDSEGNIQELVCEYENDVAFKKPKTYIHWVAESPAHNSPVALDEVRLYQALFKHDNPDRVEGGYLKDINENSLHVVKGAIANVGIYDHIADWIKKTGGKDKESMRWQFVRTGYFCLDWDTEIDLEAFSKHGNIKDAIGRLVMNRTVTLKEDNGKSS